MEKQSDSPSTSLKESRRDEERSERVEAFEEDCCREAYRAILPPIEILADSDCSSSEELVEERMLVFAPHLAVKPPPLESFEDVRLAVQVQKAAALMGLKKPTPIQKFSRPP